MADRRAASKQAKANEEAKEVYDWCFAKAQDAHERRLVNVKRQWEAYRGVLRLRDTRWQSSLHPPFINAAIEQLYAMMAIEAPETQIKPRNVASVQAAEHMAKVLGKHRSDDGFEQSWRRWVKQALIHNVSPAKIYWQYSRRSVKSPFFDPTDVASLQDSGQMPKRRWRTVDTVLADRASFAPIDLEDFMWDPSARMTSQIGYAFHKIRTSWRQLQAKSKGKNRYGIYDSAALQRVKDGAERRGQDKGSSVRGGTGSQYEHDDGGLYILHEYWSPTQLITVCDDEVIRNEPNPFTHGQLPFVIGQVYDELHSIGGLSLVDLVVDIQAAMWEMLNQRIDNARFINNAVVFFRNTMLDRKKLEQWRPGAMIPVDDPAEVTPWQPPTNLLTSAMEQQADLERMLQEQTGSVSVLSGASSEQLDPNTATQITTMQSMAQMRIQIMKENLGASSRDIDRQQCQLIEQFQTAIQSIREDSDAGGFNFTAIAPWQLIGQFEFELERASASINKQVDRVEAQTMLETMAGIAQVMAANPAGPQVNLKPAAMKFLKSYGVINPEEYFQAPQPMPLALPAGAQVPQLPTG